MAKQIRFCYIFWLLAYSKCCIFYISRGHHVYFILLFKSSTPSRLGHSCACVRTYVRAYVRTYEGAACVRAYARERKRAYARERTCVSAYLRACVPACVLATPVCFSAHTCKKYSNSEHPAREFGKIYSYLKKSEDHFEDHCKTNDFLRIVRIVV